MTDDQPRIDEASLAPISKTAIWVAAARAIGAREPDAEARNPDDLAGQLLGNSVTLIGDHPIASVLAGSYEAAMQAIEVADMVRAMIERTRFIDEALERAIADGADQILIPGAGLDSHAYRFTDLLASARVFEVDRPATLSFKQRQVNEALGGPPENLTYVPADFSREILADVLPRHGYDVSKRTFVIMEGVTMYLPEDALRAVFRFIASHPPGSGIVFDFVPRAMVESIQGIDLSSAPPVARQSIEIFLNMIENEPWLFGFTPGTEQEFLRELGMELREVLTLGSGESVRRFLTRADGSIVGAEAHARSEALREAAMLSMSPGMSDEERQARAAAMREQREQMAYRIAEAVVLPDS